MLALLELLGIAVAGTAFVSAFPGPTDEDNSTESVERHEDFDTEPDDVPDLMSLLDRVHAPVDDTPMGEILVGDEVSNNLTGGDGGDYLNGQGGDDALTCGAGDDQLHAGTGQDHVDAGEDDDQGYGDLGDDDMDGGAGDDLLHGGSGADHIHGGEGNDQILGGYGDDTLVGGAGRDMIQGSEGNDVIDGGSGETIAEVDYLNGSEGNDHLIGNDGDVMSGGTDGDRFEIVNGSVSIMDYTDEDVIVVQFEGNAPILTSEVTNSGVTLLADGAPVAALYGLTSFDVSLVELVAA